MMDSSVKNAEMILVVDDDEDFRDSLAGFLETQGYVTQEAEGGAQALLLCQERLPDLILLDAEMPGLDGFSLCSQLSKAAKTATIPIIMITGLDDAESVDKAFDAGAEEYITKPVNWSVLRLRIHRIIERKKLQAQQLIYASAFEQSPASIMITDLNGIIQHVNPSFLRISGYSKAEVVGRKPSFLRSGKTPLSVYQQLWETITHGKLWHGEFVNRKKNKEIFIESALIVPIRDQFGVMTHYLASKSDITSQRRAEMLLEQSRRDLAKAQEVSHTGSWAWNLEDDRLSWSDEMFNICRLNPQSYQPTYSGYLQRVHDEDRGSLKEAVNRTMVSPFPPFRNEHRINCDDGEVLWVETRGEMENQAQGEGMQLVGTLADITERKQREKALQESQEQYRKLLETSQFVPWELDLTTNCFTYMGPQIFDLLGNQPEEWLDIDYWLSRVHPDDRERANQICSVATAQGEDHDFEYRMIAKDGRTIWIRDVVTVVHQRDRVVGLRGFFIDITVQKTGEIELRQTMELLKKNEHQLQAILSNTSALVFLKDLQGRYLLINRRFESLFHVSNEEIQGKTVFDLYPPQAAKALHENDQKIIRNGHSMEMEEIIPQDDGIHTYLSVKFPLYDEHKTIFALGGIATDITDRKVAELKLKKAKQNAELANQAKSQFLAAMSHDIRTPMNAILGMGEILAESGLTAKQRQYLNVLTHAGEGLLALINDILDLSKIEAGQLQMETVSFDLYDLVEGAGQILQHKAAQKQIELTLAIHPDTPHEVMGDPQRLRQILLNLLGNAIKFTPEGSIDLSMAPQQGDLVRFVVSDTGIGIPKEKFTDIFRSFTQAETSTTRRFGGSGLGLAICAQLVEKMGGEIWVESELGVGSRFFFEARLPRSGDALSDEHLTHVVRQSEPRLDSLAESTKRGALKILMVDDAEDNLFVLSAFLENTPHEIEIAKNGLLALEAFKTGEFDLILMDMMMPVMDGYEATKQIRAWEQRHDWNRTPVVALTANVMRESVSMTLEAGCDLYLSKPIRKAYLLEVIGRFTALEGST